VEIIWKLDQQEITRLQAFVSERQNDAFVRSRIRKNIEAPPTSVSVDEFWYELVGCLLSSQQRSGANSPISRFLRTEPFPLSYTFFREQAKPATAGRQVLTEFGGIRFTNRIPDFLAKNLAALETGLWEPTHAVLAALIDRRTAAQEREAAEFLRIRYAGIGPKQARNLLQGLGLTRHEIPIDSRIVKWLNQFGFPVRLSSGALSDEHYYNFISDGIQAMCQQSDLVPCVLDAAIFSSYDGDDWTNDNVVG
jgi:hypothetical protein